VLDAGGRDPLPGLVGLGRVAPEGLLADDVLSGSAAAIVGSPWRLLGPELSKSCTRSSATSVFQSVTWSAKPYRRAASETASSLRPAMDTSCGISGGGQVM
jgi:hypothetical protein